MGGRGLGALAVGADILVARPDALEESVAASAAPVLFRGAQGLEADHPVGDRDLALGLNALWQPPQKLVLEVLVIPGQGEAHIVRPDQAVVGEGELAIVHVAGLHDRESDRGRLRYDHGSRHVGLVGGGEDDVVLVLDGDLGDLPFHSHQVVVQEHLLVHRDPRLDP